jgi:hypothetical protein
MNPRSMHVPYMPPKPEFLRAFENRAEPPVEAKQGLFIAEIVLREKDMSDPRLEEALDRIREIGSVTIKSATLLPNGDKRAL